MLNVPPLESILVSVNSDAVRKDVGGGIVLEIVIDIALPIQDAFIATLKNPHPQPLLTTLVALLLPLDGVCAVFDHRVAFVVIVVMANVEVLLMPPPLPPQSSSLCCAPGGDK